MKQKLIKIAVIFLGLMIVFTILSRAAYNISTPKVVLGKAEEMEMGPDISGSGTVEASEMLPVASAEQKVVRKIHVLAGQSVKAGDVLYELDLEKLEEEIAKKQQEIKGIDLQLESARSMKDVAAQSKKMMQSQALSDYERARQAADYEIAEAETAWQNAEAEYEQFKKNPSLFPERTEQEFLQSIDEKKSLYDAALRAKEESLYQAQKAIDSANAPEAKDTSIEQMELTKTTAEKELSALKELQDGEGKVLSPIDGVVAAVNIQVGGMTSGTADLLIADSSAEMLLKVQFPEQYKEYIVNGTAVKLTSETLMEKEIEAIGKLKIEAVQQNEETGGTIEATILIPQNTLPIGTSVGVQIETSKTNYLDCVPLEALHQEDENTYYVYVTDEKKTILGTETVAQRVDVTLDYKGERYAAVKGLALDQEIILSSTKQLKNGGRVKPQEQ